MNEIQENNNLNTLATEINSIKEQTRKIVLSNSIEIGRRLTDAKSMCEHGEWGEWLKNSVDYTQRTAQQLMKIFDEYSSDQISVLGESNTKALADLSYTQAIILMGIPKEEREDFIEENDIDELSTRELKEVVDENKKLKFELKEYETEFDKIAAEKSASDKRIEELVDELKDANSEEEIKELQTDLGRQKEKNETLKEKLQKKPKTVEIIPDEIKEELSELRELVSREDSPEMVRVRYMFSAVIEQFDKLLAEITSLNDIDSDMGSKLQLAARELTTSMFAKVEI